MSVTAAITFAQLPTLAMLAFFVRRVHIDVLEYRAFSYYFSSRFRKYRIAFLFRSRRSLRLDPSTIRSRSESWFGFRDPG
jgi:hypothetical protein